MIGSGRNSIIREGCSNFIGGGGSHDITGVNYSLIAGGYHNLVTAAYSLILGGGDNCITTGATYSSIVGGRNNTITGAVSCYSAILGGHNNTISAGHHNSFIIGSNLSSVANHTTHVERMWTNGFPLLSAGIGTLPVGTFYVDDVATPGICCVMIK